MVDLFKRDLSEADLEFLYFEAIEDVISEYRIKKRPTSSSVKGFLAGYTKDTLYKLVQANGAEAKKSWKKGRIIEDLHQHIAGTLAERVLILNDRELALLERFMNNEFDTKDITRNETEFFVNVFPVGVKMGLLFIEENSEDEFSFFVSKELLDIFQNLDEVREEYQEKMTFVRDIEDVLRAGVHLYGILSTSRLLELWEIKYPDYKYTLDFYDDFHALIPLITIKHDYHFVKNRLIASDKFVDSEEVQKFNHKYSEKMGADYYVPTKDEMMYYADHSFNRASAKYKKVQKRAEKYAEDSEFTMETLEFHLVNGHGVSFVMRQIEKHELMQFKTQKQLEKFVDVYVELHNNTRMWENGGFTPMELRPEELKVLDERREPSKNDVPFSKNRQRREKQKQQPIHVKKIGRNDPCPCGSGKKYKKCHMKKA